MTDYKGGRFTADEEAFLTRHYWEKGPAWCAQQLGRDPVLVSMKGFRMELTRPGRKSVKPVKPKAEPKPIPRKAGDVINPLPIPVPIEPLPKLPWPSITRCARHRLH